MITRMRVIRKKSGVTQVDVARIVGLDVSHLSLIENGKKYIPRKRHVEYLEEYFSLPFEKLVAPATQKEIEELHKLELNNKKLYGSFGGLVTKERRGSGHYSKIGAKHEHILQQKENKSSGRSHNRGGKRRRNYKKKHFRW